MEKALKLPVQTRDFENCELTIIKRAADGARQLSFPVSAETPVERYYGNEVLSHAPGAIRMERIQRRAVPLLFNHDFGDPIGMVDAGAINNRRLVVDAHSFTTQRAQDVAAMVDGGLHNVSLTYRVHKMAENKSANTFTATDWEPLEVSIVTVPADASVGIGRGVDLETFDVPIETNPAQPAAPKGDTTVSETENAAAGASAESKGNGSVENRAAPTGMEMDRERRQGIENMAKAANIDSKIVEMWCTRGYSLADVARELLKITEERGKAGLERPVTHLDMTRSETAKFSLFRAVAAAADKNWQNAGFERECSLEIAKRLDRVPDPNTFFVPYDVLQRSIEVPISKLGRRDVSVAASGGGYLVETVNVGFIEMLRNRSVAYRLGARRMPGLVGNVTIPRQSAAGTAVWLASETATITESQLTLEQVSLTPKTVGGYTEVSRLLLLQSVPAAEGIVTADLSAVVAIAIDAAAIAGSGGSGQPQGIIGSSGVGSLTGASFAYADAIESQTDLAAANVMPVSAGYAATPAVAAVLMEEMKAANTFTPVWEGNVWDGSIMGFPAMSSLQVPTGDLIFGDWAQLIVGEWGVLQVDVNPFANFQAAIIGIRAIATVDIALRYGAAFTVATSVT